MKVKIWRVRIGNSWTNCDVVARNAMEAIHKALRNEAPLPRDERFVSSVELLAESDY